MNICDEHGVFEPETGDCCPICGVRFGGGRRG